MFPVLFNQIFKQKQNLKFEFTLKTFKLDFSKKKTKHEASSAN